MAKALTPEFVRRELSTRAVALAQALHAKCADDAAPSDLHQVIYINLVNAWRKGYAAKRGL